MSGVEFDLHQPRMTDQYRPVHQKSYVLHIAMQRPGKSTPGAHGKKRLPARCLNALGPPPDGHDVDIIVHVHAIYRREMYVFHWIGDL